MDLYDHLWAARGRPIGECAQSRLSFLMVIALSNTKHYESIDFICSMQHLSKKLMMRQAVLARMLASTSVKLCLLITNTDSASLRSLEFQRTIG